MSEAGPDVDRIDMERLVADEPGALDALIDRHGGALFAYLRRVLGQAEDAADLAQETFVRVHAHRARFDLQRPFKTWLFSIATNLARDRLRWRQRHPETPLEDSGDEAHPQPRRSFIDPSHSPAEALEQNERSNAVRDAVASLPDDLRFAIVLAEFEDQSLAEIAHVMGCTPKAVEMRLYRARHTLRHRLASWLPR